LRRFAHFKELFSCLSPVFLFSLPAIRQLVSDGATFYVSHSGGKDSMAMYAIT
jgi:hypothetical protein